MPSISISRSNLIFILAALAGIVTIPTRSFACEPVIPLAMLYSGTTIFGAVALKSLTGLFIAVTIKCVVFYWKSDIKGISSLWYMIIANAYSTVPGLLLGLAFAAPVIILIIYPILLIPGGNVKNYSPFRKIGRFGAAGILMFLIFLSGIIYTMAMSIQDTSLIGYWGLKVLYSTLAIAISFIITVVCEDGIISYLYEKKHKTSKSFLRPVILANVAVFLIVIGIGAAVAIPKRIAAPNFLIQKIKQIVTETSV